MRLFYILGLLFIFIVNSAFSQKHPDLIWSKWMGGPVNFSPDGKYIFAKVNQQIIKVSRETGTTIDTMYDTHSPYYAIYGYEVSQDGKLLLVISQVPDQGVTLWNIADKKLVYTFKELNIITHPAPVHSSCGIVFSPDSRTIAFATLETDSDNPSINLWDISSKTIVWSQKMPDTSPPTFIQYIKGTDYLYTFDIASYGNLWNTKTGVLVKSTSDRQYSPNGKIFASYINDSIAVFNSATEQEITTFPIGSAITFSPQGKYVLFANDDSVKAVQKTTLWDLVSGKAINHYESSRYSDSYLSFSPDSQYIAVSTRYNTDLYRFNTATSVEETSAQTFHLSATPNPTSAQSLVTFMLLKESAVKLSVFDATGSEVLKLFSGQGSFGENRFRWNTENLPQGVYFIRLEADGKSAQVQCAVVR